MQLSYSALSVFKECKRCFWLDRNKKLLRPRGIFSSLPIGIDNLLKKHLELYRGTMLPSMLSKYPQLEGYQLYGGADLKKMRNWATNPFCLKDNKGNILVGAFDDLLYNPITQTYALLDYKTKGSEPDQEYCEKYYQTQMDIYTRFLEIGGKKVASFGVLLYFWPVENADNIISFDSKPFFLTPHTDNADLLFKEAVECLEGELPPPNPSCEYCSYHQKLERNNL